jgi:hypothetical protein
MGECTAAVQRYEARATKLIFEILGFQRGERCGLQELA